MTWHSKVKIDREREVKLGTRFTLNASCTRIRKFLEWKCYYGGFVQLPSKKC